FTSGCAGPEQKLGRGATNFYEVIRGGEQRRSIEQSTVFDSTGDGYATGFVRGFDRSMARAGIGLYEIVTFPIPPYHPIATKYLPPGPAYPDNYKPGLSSGTLFETDTYVGFGGGDVAPWFPGSRFSVFDN
ncbi:MAG: exosortase system-associated protein, TIGR04073 family, partial [Limisphaerales bacterium]